MWLYPDILLMDILLIFLGFIRTSIDSFPLNLTNTANLIYFHQSQI